MFIEFSQMHLGHQVSDLYRFMRKVMEKHGWDEYLGGAMLDAYDAVQPMGAKETAVPVFSVSVPGKILEAAKLLLQCQQGLDPGKKCGKIKDAGVAEGGKRAISVENKIGSADRFIFLFFSR